MAGSQSGSIIQFPSQAVSDKKKMSKAYGTSVASAIEGEWWRRDSGQGRFQQTRDEYHRLRLYARGEQSIRKYKDEFSINGDLSYLNLDWKPVPIIPKFVDIVVNGMQDRLFKIKAFAQDPIATDKRTAFVKAIERDMNTQQLLGDIESQLGVSARNVEKEDLPTDSEELGLYMQLQYKQGIEIAEEQAIDNILLRNKYSEIKRRLDYDQVILGISCAKHEWNNTDGIKLEYVDPSDIIYSYTEDPNFEDVYYFGEIKRLRINELKKQFPSLTDAEFEEITEKSSSVVDYNANRYERYDSYDKNTVTLMYFNWKTWENNVYKIKETSSGASKAIKKDDEFNPPKDARARFEKVATAREVIYEGVWIMGMNKLLKWKKADNMIRPQSNANKVLMNYIVSAPRMYKGRLESLVSRMTPFADLIQLSHLKLQQTIQRLTPSGVYLDADGLAEIDLGNGTSYNPQEALNMYFQTGSIIGRSLTMDGDPNPGKIPIQELPGGGGGQVEILVNAYNHYIQNIRDITGLNEARDGADPDPYSLVGVQKLAAANSNTATRHLMHASMSITLRVCEAIALRLKDVLNFHPQKDTLMNSIGRFSVGSLEELKNLHLHDFGIFLELEPDEEEKQLLEANIQAALAKESIYLEDAIDVREIKNLKLANQLLKYRRIRKQQADQEQAESAQKAQAEAQAAAQAQIEEAKAQAAQVIAQQKMQEEQMKSQLKQAEMMADKDLKKELMQFEFDLNVKLKGMELQAQKEIIETQTENNKEVADKNNESAERREGMKAKAAAQKSVSPSSVKGPPKSGKPAKSFESKGNDVLGGFNLESFEPK